MGERKRETNALFVSALTFSGKWFIFQKAFSRKLSYFLVFGNDLENELENVFKCLVCNLKKIYIYIYIYFLYNLKHVYYVN